MSDLVTAPDGSTPRASTKLWLYRACTAVGIPGLLLVGLEAALRIFDYGTSPHFLVADARPGWVRSNPDYVRRFVPEGQERRPHNFRFPVRKDPDTVRVVVLGESAAHGLPVPAFGFVAQLRAQLRARYPSRQIEVLNAGIAGIDSHVAYYIAREFADFGPDVFVVYVGANEVVGPNGPGNPDRATVRSCRAVRFDAWLKGTRLAQLLAAPGHRRRLGHAALVEDRGVPGCNGRPVPADDPRLAATRQNFETNLHDIVRVADAVGARTVLCTLPANLAECPPFLSQHRPDLAGADLAEWEKAFAAGRRAWQLAEYTVARPALERAWQLDPQYAETAFLLGDIEREAGNAPAARAQFLQALHWDALRLRPDPELNAIVRRVATGESSVQLVDLARDLGADPESRGDLPGRELFLDQVHPDWAGAFAIGRTLAEAVARGVPPGDDVGGDWLDDAAAAAALGCTPPSRFTVLQAQTRLVQSPPFTNQLTYGEDQARLALALAKAEPLRRDATAMQAARNVLALAIARDPTNADLSRLSQELAEAAGDIPSALEELRRGRSLQPADVTLAADEAMKLSRLGRGAEAETLLRAAAASATPRDFLQLAPAMADSFTRAQRLPEGRQWLDEALTRFPAAEMLQYQRGLLAWQAKDRAAAEADFRAVLATQPSAQPALESLVSLLTDAGDVGAAAAVSREFADLQPANQANNFRVAEKCEAAGDLATAVHYYLAAAHSGAVSTAIELRIATFLYQLDRREESLDHLAVAWRLSLLESDRDVSEAISALVKRIRAEVAAPAKG